MRLRYVRLSEQILTFVTRRGALKIATTLAYLHIFGKDFVVITWLSTTEIIPFAPVLLPTLGLLLPQS